MKRSKTRKILHLVSLVPEFHEHGNVSFAVASFVLKSFLMKAPEVTKNYKIGISIFDLQDNDEVIVKCLCAQKATITGFTCYVWTVEKTLRIAKTLKLVSPQVKIILGGPSVDEHLFQENPFIDYAVEGEGELPLLNFLKSNIHKQSTDNIEGLMYRKGKDVFINAGTTFVKNLDEIPSIVESKEFMEQRNKTYYPDLFLETSRGCPYRCAYCRWYSGKLRFLSLDAFEKTIKTLTERISSDREYIVTFIDAHLDMDIPRLKLILKILCKYKKQNISYSGYFLLRNFDDEVLFLMEQSNFRYIAFGQQSIHEDVLAGLNRAWFKKEFLEKLIEIKERFSVVVDLIYGLPGDNYEKFKHSLMYLWDRGIDNIRTMRLLILPRTQFRSEIAKYKIVYDLQPPHMEISNESFSSEDIYKAEQLGTNLRFLTTLLKRPDFKIIQREFGVNLFEIAENIHRIIPEWEFLMRKRYVKINKEGKVEAHFDPEIVAALVKYFECVSPKRGNRDALATFLELRRQEHLLACEVGKILYSSAVTKIAARGDLKLQKVFLPGYRKIEAGQIVLNWLLKRSQKKKNKQNYTLFLIYNFSKEKTEYIETPHPEIMELLFRILSKPIQTECLIDVLTDMISGLRSKTVEAFLNMLCDKATLLYIAT
jgi:radical SAM superfamily enzyme YgiQ (UPF0313 family)